MYSKRHLLSTLHRYKSYIESEGYTVYAIMLKGSQNYNLSDEQSDIDANAILLPNSMKDIKNGIKQKFSFNTGDVVAHDIYSFADILRKGNPQWVEVVNSKYTIGNDLTMFQHIKLNPSALKGMLMEKSKQMTKLFK